MSGIHDEEKYFSDVSETILKKINILAAGLVKIKNRVAETRDEMWVETHIVRNFDDAAHLSTLLNAVSLEERQYISESKQLSQLKRMLETPYFGRVDFIENGNEKAETIYVGINSLSDDNDRFFFVYDWRAPISSLFYDYGIGESSFAAPDGIIKGETILKRQYKTEKGKLIFYCDTDLTIGDEILKYELSKTSDAKIKVIINTIQQEQNRIIRSDADNLLVFGPAGSGKTSVGLHRLAYLLYKNRSGLNSAGIRIFSSSYIFSTYISGVIPELGEEDVQTLDFLDLFDKHLKKRAHDMFFQIESLIENDDPSHSMYIKIKHSKDFVDFTEQYIKSFFPNEIGDAIFFEKIICDKNKIMSLYADRTSKSTLQSKTGRVTDYLSECYDEFFAAETQLIHDTFNDHYDEKFNKQEIKEHFEIYKALSVNQYKNLLSPDAVVLYNRIVRAYAVKNNLPQKFTKFTESSLEQEILFYEDALMLLYIEILIGKIKAEPAVRHILIDEAQDMGHLQHAIIKRLFDGCRFTLLADINQALYPEINMTDKIEIEEIYRPVNIMELTKSYRSTTEINRFNAELIGKYNEADYYCRNGDAPEIIIAEDKIKAAASIIAINKNKFNTIGILMFSNKKAREFYAGLKKYEEDINFIINANDEFKPGIVLMSAPYAKGLEFDAVIIPEYGEKYLRGEKNLRTFYLMCTRALHKLILID